MPTRIALLNRLRENLVNPVPQEYRQLPNGRYVGPALRVRRATPEYLKEEFKAGEDGTLLGLAWAEAIYAIRFLNPGKSLQGELGLLNFSSAKQYWRHLRPRTIRDRWGNPYEAEELPERGRAHHVYGPLIHRTGVMVKRPTITITPAGEVVPTALLVAEQSDITALAQIKQEGIEILPHITVHEGPAYQKLSEYTGLPTKTIQFGSSGWSSPRTVNESRITRLLFEDVLSPGTRFNPTVSIPELTPAKH